MSFDSEAWLAEARALIGEAHVLSADRGDDLSAYTRDWRNKFEGPALAVLRPANTGEVQAIVRFAARSGVAIIPQGGNTGMCGASVPTANGRQAILQLGRLNRLLDIDPENNTATVEAGCILQTLQEQAVAAGRLFPLSLGAEGSCQIGGNIATNAGGTGVLRYGNTRENVLGLEVVLPDATIWNGLRALRKDNSGFDLKHLFIGSEGLLGIITAATLKLHPLNTRHVAAWLAPVSLDAAVELLALFQASLEGRLTAFEIMNAAHVHNALALGTGLKSPLDPAHPWHLLAELGDAAADDGLRASLENLLQAALSHGLLADAAVASNEAQRAAMWAMRHSVADATQKAGRGITHDIAVPVSKIPEFMRRVSPVLEQRFAGMRIVIVGHLGDGNLHFIPLFEFDAWDAFPEPQAVIDEVHRLTYAVAAELGGTFSAEHGIGRYLVAEMRQYKSAVELSLMRSIKRALDPQGLFNPAKVIPQ